MPPIELTQIERDTLISWRKESSISLPNEEQLLNILRNHSGGKILLTDNQVVIITSWAEAGVDKNFGSGAIANIIDAGLLEKIRNAYNSIP